MLCPYWTTLTLPLDYFRNIPATSRFTGFRTAELIRRGGKSHLQL